MEPTEDQTFEKYGTQKINCIRNTILPYAYDSTGLACGYN